MIEMPLNQTILMRPPTAIEFVGLFLGNILKDHSDSFFVR